MLLPRGMAAASGRPSLAACRAARRRGLRSCSRRRSELMPPAPKRSRSGCDPLARIYARCGSSPLSTLGIDDHRGAVEIHDHRHRRLLVVGLSRRRPSVMPTSCSNPNALGISRVVEIDTTGGPGFGFEHFKSHDFLREGEVVLTFDDGPWPKNTPAVLAALAAHCTKAIFFPIGLHATYEPGILKQVAAAGHAIGSHTWCHQDLSKTKGRCNVNGKVQTV